jgi:hypothetical protein
LDDYIFCGQLDDRLGAYLILDYFKQAGMQYDILLTEGEEFGMSTARYFKTDKQYNWMFSFDRRGRDCVLYQFEDKDTKELVERYGWKVSMGSFSDLRMLSDLGCKGFNFGCGYDDNHSVMSHANEADLLYSIRCFARFYNDLANTYLFHDPEKEIRLYKRQGWMYGEEDYEWGAYYKQEYWKPWQGASPKALGVIADTEDEKWAECDRCGLPIAQDDSEHSKLRPGACVFCELFDDDELDDNGIWMNNEKVIQRWAQT